VWIFCLYHLGILSVLSQYWSDVVEANKSVLRFKSSIICLVSYLGFVSSSVLAEEVFMNCWHRITEINGKGYDVTSLRNLKMEQGIFSKSYLRKRKGKWEELCVNKNIESGSAQIKKLDSALRCIYKSAAIDDSTVDGDVVYDFELVKVTGNLTRKFDDDHQLTDLAGRRFKYVYSDCELLEKADK